MSTNWMKNLSEARFNKGDGSRKRIFHEQYGSSDFRVAHEKDFDRIVFSTPVRRLQDKTQIFPLDQHDSVRTRLTHSLEVATIARTLAAQFAEKLGLSSTRVGAERAVPALVAAISIAHDIGNPPFGHQGEDAIKSWVAKAAVTFRDCRNGPRDEALLQDYLYFDGNPQGFRLLTKLQGVEGGGLNLTASTLRAMFKYPRGSNSPKVDSKKPKFGFFQSEKDIFDWCSDQTEVPEGELHPLTAIMEACDDIAYSVLDVEDGIKKELSSPAHLMVYLENRSIGTAAEEWVEVLEQQYEGDLKWLLGNGIGGRHSEDILTQMLRSYLIALAVSVAVPALDCALKNGSARATNACLAEPRCAALLRLLKDYSKEYIYSHRSVERIELQGHRIIPYLLGAFWMAIANKESKTQTKLDEYVIKHMPENYLKIYSESKETFPSWYSRLQLVCDMVCGMTDSYAVKLSGEFKELGVNSLS
ncbi:MAG: deoxyguanosinetriphosphate triphosphohydrolase family protein [Rhodanobacter sp.]